MKRFNPYSRYTTVVGVLTLSIGLVGACSDSGNPDEDQDDDNSNKGSGGEENASGGAAQGDGGSQTSGTGGKTSMGGNADNSGGSQGSSDGGALVGQGGEGGSGPDFPDLMFNYDPTLDEEPKSCANDTVAAEPIPLDMYVVLDRTGSMGTDCAIDLDSDPSISSKWCRAVHAMGKYFTSDAATGHRAALQFMTAPAASGVSGDEICPPGVDNPHSTAVVDLTLLPDLPAGALVSALDDENPGGVTEIESALNGITDFTLANQVDGRKMIGILVTDGDPGGACSTSTTLLGNITADHYVDTGIPTFIIGMTGATASTLEAMAVEGGAPEHTDFCDPTDTSCHYWSVGDGDPTAFVAALSAIQDSVIGCEFSVPSTEDGLVQLDTVKVQFTEDDMTAAITLARATDLAACAENQYYTVDVAGTPTINLCPTTCARVGTESAIDVEIQCSGN